jgi:hypothetical protein
VLELCWNLLELAPAAAAAALRPLPPSSAASGTSSHQLTAGDSSNAQVLMLSGAPSAAADGVPLADQGEVSAAAAAAAVEAGGSYGGEAEEGAAPDTAGAAGAAAGGAWVLEGLVVSLLQLAGELLATAECKQVRHHERHPSAGHWFAPGHGLAHIQLFYIALCFDPGTPSHSSSAPLYPPLAPHTSPLTRHPPHTPSICLLSPSTPCSVPSHCSSHPPHTSSPCLLIPFPGQGAPE